MVDIINIVAQQAAAQRSQPQSVLAAASVDASSSSRKQGFLNSRIRVDNLQDVVFLEFRASDGEVLEQYPTQGQIEAFKRAERLLQQYQRTAQVEQTTRYVTKDTESHEAPRVPQAPISAPAPATVPVSAGVSAYSAASDSGNSSLHSVFA